MTRSAALVVAVAAGLLVAAPIGAQAPMALDGGGGAPRLAVHGVLDDDALEDAVRSGLPLRMRFRVELWRDELIDDLVAQTQWSVGVALEPLEQRFLAGVVGGDTVGSYESWEDVRDAVERSYEPGIATPLAGRYYYIGFLEIETLSLSDLDELERWMRGELEPAVRGDRTVGGAIGTGLKRLLIRILGLPARRYEVRTDAFRVP